MRGNPNHPVTSEMRDQWHKLCALVMFKLGQTRVEITAEDIATLEISGKANITIRPMRDVITLELVSDSEAKRLSREEGGLPI